MPIKKTKTPYHRLLALWTLRALAVGFGRSKFLADSGYPDSELAMLIGLPENPDQNELRKLPILMNNLHAALEKSSAMHFPASVQNNFDQFASALKLNTTEQRILEWIVCMAIEKPFDMRTYAPRHMQASPAKFISQILKLPQKSVSKAIAPSARLMKSGLLEISMGFKCPGAVKFYSDEVANQLLFGRYDLAKILKSFGVASPPLPQLGLLDYPHIQQSLDLLIPYLKVVRQKRKLGVNVLVHGAPGTGKTQLVRVIAKALNLSIFELATADEDGKPLGSSKRLNVIDLAQTFLRDAPVILTFDEAEDILTTSFHDRGVANTHKGWFNQTLENNPQPVFWISNKIDSLDPAFARRFDFILEVPVPSKSQREKILTDQVGTLISPELIHQLSMAEHLAPAVVTRARDVVRAVGKNIPASGRDAAYTHVICGILRAQGHADPSKLPIQPIQAGLYDIAHVNTKADLQQIALQLKQNPSARLCLYGPPGTGKTAFGHWLASEIGQPLSLKKASDLVHPHVGMTERLIAQAFERAKRDGAVLMIDEVDSFLQDRTHAQRSWEISQVNEMLTQIESFSGIMIASTNLIDQLDIASLRRFDIKLHFDYLRPEQAACLLVSYCKNLKLPPPTPADLRLVNEMQISTPGDFAAVARQHKFQPFRDAGGLLEAVSGELAHKSGHLRRIGFQ